MEKERIINILVELYNDYYTAIMRSKGNYTDNDFNSLEKFITFIHNQK